eukprot:Opistho-2@53416
MPKAQREDDVRSRSRSHPYKENKDIKQSGSTSRDGAMARKPAEKASSGSVVTSSADGDKKEKRSQTEDVERMLQQRQKQIDYGKNTLGYQRYRKTVPHEKRTNTDPRTPDKFGDYSKRQWDGIVKAWRRALHTWDPPADDKEMGGGEEELCADDIAAMHGDILLSDMEDDVKGTSDVINHTIYDDVDIDSMLDSQLRKALDA